MELDPARGSHVRLHVARVARRVERLRGLRFHPVPRVVVKQPEQLPKVSARLRSDALRRLRRIPGRLQRIRYSSEAQSGFDTLAGLLPQETATDASASASSELFGGAYDYRRGEVILIDRVATTRTDVQRVLAHELTHALEDQHFDLRFATSRGPGQSAQARRALFEGTATFVAARYDGRYLHDQLPIGLRLGGQRSVFGAGGSIPFAVKSSTIFDYVDGALYVRRLYIAGGWAEVNAALRRPPKSTRQILHPLISPQRAAARPVRLDLGRILAPDHFLAGSSVAGEQDVLGLLESGAPDQTAEAAASGWQGGRFELWRLAEGDCESPCPGEDVGVMAIRLRSAGDRAKVDDAFFDYALLARLGERLTLHTWHFLNGQYGAIHFRRHSAAIAFAPGQALANSVAASAARQASG